MDRQVIRQAQTPSPEVTEVPRRAWIRAFGIGAAFGAAAFVVASLLPTRAAFGFFAVVLGVIAGTYLGFGIRDGRIRNLGTESVGLVLYGGLATLALAVENGPLLAAGLIGHTVWDLLHRVDRRGLDTTLPHWLIPLCMGADVVLGIAVLARIG